MTNLKDQPQYWIRSKNFIGQKRICILQESENDSRLWFMDLDTEEIETLDKSSITDRKKI